MRIAVTAGGPDLQSNVEARFGRCRYFVVVDTDTMNVEAIENPNAALGGGAGIQSAQLMAEKDVEAVLTGNCGPNAFQVFGAAGVKVIVGVGGRVREAVEQFKAGAFSAAAGANVQSHFGMSPGTDSTEQATDSTGTGGTMGRGMGGGRGMGMGSGRGMGRGMGMGSGRGMGRGMGMGGAMQGFQQQFTPPGGDPQTKQNYNDVGSEVAVLKQQAQALEDQLSRIHGRIQELEQGGLRTALPAVVESRSCTGCGRCVSVCPTGAIALVDGVAQIDSARCNGCGQCVSACPRKAIRLGPR